jgi:hypothetical protein
LSREKLVETNSECSPLYPERKTDILSWATSFHLSVLLVVKDKMKTFWSALRPFFGRFQGTDPISWEFTCRLEWTGCRWIFRFPSEFGIEPFKIKRL